MTEVRTSWVATWTEQLWCWSSVWYLWGCSSFGKPSSVLALQFNDLGDKFAFIRNCWTLTNYHLYLLIFFCKICFQINLVHTTSCNYDWFDENNNFILPIFTYLIDSLLPSTFADIFSNLSFRIKYINNTCIINLVVLKFHKSNKSQIWCWRNHGYL